MMDNFVAWVANLLQNDPEGAAALLILLLGLNIMNTFMIVCIGSDIDGIKKTLRKRGIWV